MFSASRTHSLSRGSRVKELCLDVARLVRRGRRVAVVHHWDCDGVASSALLTKLVDIEELAFFIPRIGLYSVDAVPIKEIGSADPDLVILLDYGMSGDRVDELEKRLGKPVAVIDHHVVEGRSKAFCNPVASGFPEELYPSTTYVLFQELGAFNDRDKRILDLVALGIVADLGWRADLDLSRWLPSYSGSLEALRMAAAMVDSCYRLGDYACIDYARGKLLGDIENVVNDPYLRSRYELVEREIRSALEHAAPTHAKGSTLVFEIDTSSYVTSAIGRELAKRYPRNVVVLVNRVRSLGMGYVYVRSASRSLRNVLTELRSRGLVVGGKDRVVVVTCSSMKCEELGEVLNALKKLGSA